MIVDSGRTSVELSAWLIARRWGHPARRTDTTAVREAFYRFIATALDLDLPAVTNTAL